MTAMATTGSLSQNLISNEQSVSDQLNALLKDKKTKEQVKVFLARNQVDE